jgi:hypothetical protein
MAAPAEPLLPVDPDPPPRPKRSIVLAAVGAAAAAIVAAGLLATRGGGPPPAEGPAPLAGDRGSARAPKKEPGAAGAPGDAAEERRAKELYDAAEAFERADPGEYERRAAHWRAVITTFPTSIWARKADQNYRATTTALEAFLDREFESTRKDAQALAAAGHYQDAIETIQSFKSAQTRDLLKRRAEVEIGVMENASRLAFNEAATKAKELAAQRDYAAARALFESLAGGAIPEVAARCRTVIDQLRNALAAQALHAESRRKEEARRAFRESAGPKLRSLVRSRQYDDALKELALPSSAALKDDIARERAAVADASSFWEAFLKTLRSRVGQDASLLLADGRRLAGRIAKIQPDRIVIEAAEGSVEAPLDSLHADVLVGWTIGRALAAEDPMTYLKAAFFFFCEGRDDLAKLYLATAKELNAPTEAAEKVFREGILRSATPLRK